MRTFVASVLASLLVACGGGGDAITVKATPELSPVAVEALAAIDDIDKQQAAGTMTREVAAAARLDVARRTQLLEPGLVRQVEVKQQSVDDKKQAEVWLRVILIVTRAITLTGDSCTSCNTGNVSGHWDDAPPPGNTGSVQGHW